METVIYDDIFYINIQFFFLNMNTVNYIKILNMLSCKQIEI